MRQATAWRTESLCAVNPVILRSSEQSSIWAVGHSVPNEVFRPRNSARQLPRYPLILDTVLKSVRVHESKTLSESLRCGRHTLRSSLPSPALDLDSTMTLVNGQLSERWQGKRAATLTQESLAFGSKRKKVTGVMSPDDLECYGRDFSFRKSTAALLREATLKMNFGSCLRAWSQFAR